MDLIFTESELRVVEGRAPIASNPSGAILDECKDDECLCGPMFDRGHCENGKCVCPEYSRYH